MAGILSLIFGILGTILSYWYVGAALCAAGIALGAVNLADVSEEGTVPILGILFSILGIVMSVFFVASDIKSGNLIVQSGKFSAEKLSSIVKNEKAQEEPQNYAFERDEHEPYKPKYDKEEQITPYNSWEAYKDKVENSEIKPTEQTKNDDEKKEVDEVQEEKRDNNGLSKNVYRRGETANCNGLELTFLGYTESNGTEYNSPADGKVFVFPEFEVYNGTSEKVTMDTWTPFLYYCDGYNVESSTNAIFSMSELDLDVLTGDIVQGGRMKACLPLELPSDWKKMEIFYKDNYFGDTEFSFVFDR